MKKKNALPSEGNAAATFLEASNQNSYKYLCYVLSATAAEHEHAGREERKLVS